MHAHTRMRLTGHSVTCWHVASSASSICARCAAFTATPSASQSPVATSPHALTITQQPSPAHSPHSFCQCCQPWQQHVLSSGFVSNIFSPQVGLAAQDVSRLSIRQHTLPPLAPTAAATAASRRSRRCCCCCQWCQAGAWRVTGVVRARCLCSSRVHHCCCGCCCCRCICRWLLRRGLCCCVTAVSTAAAAAAVFHHVAGCCWRAAASFTCRARGT